MNKPYLYPTAFSYKPPIGGVKKVELAGDFNNWQPQSMEESGGNWNLIIPLPKGIYAYKFVADGRWLPDENAKRFRGDGLGDRNSVVQVGEDHNLIYEVPFKYYSAGHPQMVNLTGSFNQWDKEADPMTWNGENWFTLLYLKAGEYHYKFVEDRDFWLPDPYADRNIDDGMGGKESVCLVDDRFLPCRPQRGDGRILTWGLAARQDFQQVNPLSLNTVEFKTKAYKNDVEAVYLYRGGELLPMRVFTGDDVFEWYKLELSIPPMSAFDYCFVYQDGDYTIYLMDGKVSSVIDKKAFFRFDWSEARRYFTPDWVKDGIFYQIFPDRFANGDNGLNQDFSEIWYNPQDPVSALSPAVRDGKYRFIKNWFDTTPLEDKENPGWFCFYGGDLAGVLNRLDYLMALGVNILYFNPLNPAESPHHYDSADYFKVCPHLGGDDTFKELVRVCHEHGMRVIVDFAFNHTGSNHYAFRDALHKGVASPYYNWYEFKKWPLPAAPDDRFIASDYYQCWWGFSTLPDLDYDLKHPHPAENSFRNETEVVVNQPMVEHILAAAEYWLREFDIDGFRLDVPNEVPWWFWARFRQKVMAVKPDAYLVGEIWSDAHEWVNSNYFHAVMNYNYFRDPVLSFFCRREITADVFAEEISTGLINYPSQAAAVMMNLLSSHDTYRLHDAAGGDMERIRLAVLFQMTFVGAPHVYYGDEIGSTGGKDPENRKPFDWRWPQDPERRELHDWYARLIHLRRNQMALRRGDFTLLKAQGRFLAFARTYKNSQVLVAINTGNKVTTLSLPEGLWHNLLPTGGEFRHEVIIPGGQGAVLVPAN